MKKLLSLLLTGALSLSLVFSAAACGEEKTQQIKPPQDQTTPENPDGKEPEDKDPDDPQTPDTPTTPDEPGGDKDPEPENPDDKDPENPDEKEPEEKDPQNPDGKDPENPDEKDPQNPDEKGPEEEEPIDPANDPDEKSDIGPGMNYLDPWISAYSNTQMLAVASHVKREITVSGDLLVVYSLTQDYEKTDAGYKVEETERRLNELGKDEAFEESKNSKDITEAPFAQPLNLSISDFVSIPSFDGGVSGRIKRSSAVRIFGLENTRKITNIWISTVSDGFSVYGYTLSFDYSGGYTIKISVSLS